MGDNSFLKISGIKKSFGSGDNRTEVLRGIDFEVAKGEFCVLLGPSGSGKSTLLNIIGGIDSPDSGYISIDGEKTGDMDEKTLTRYRRKHLGYVFQMYNLIPNLNVKENVEVGAYLRILTSCFIHWGFMSTDISSQISCRVDSSRGPRLEGQS